MTSAFWNPQYRRASRRFLGLGGYCRFLALCEKKRCEPQKPEESHSEDINLLQQLHELEVGAQLAIEPLGLDKIIIGLN